MLPASLLILLATLASVPTTIRPTVPNFRDLTIKIRETRGLSHPMVHAYYFKGPRERTEILPEGGNRYRIQRHPHAVRPESSRSFELVLEVLHRL